MEILSNIYITEEYTITPFVNKHFRGYSLGTPIHHKDLGDILNNRKLIPAMQQIMARPWRSAHGLISHQKTLLELEADDFANVLLLKSAGGDRLCLMIIGTKKVMEYVIIAFVGEEEVFESYLKDLNIPSIAVYSNIITKPEE